MRQIDRQIDKQSDDGIYKSYTTTFEFKICTNKYTQTHTLAWFIQKLNNFYNNNLKTWNQSEYLDKQNFHHCD